MKNPFRKKRQGSRLRTIVALAKEGKVQEGRDAMLAAEMHYFNKVQKAITPFPTDDTALIVTMLRHIADRLEETTPETKRNAELVKKNFVPMELKINIKNEEVK